MGIGDKLVAVDYEKLRHGVKGTVLLDATKEQLTSYPAFAFADDKASYERRIAQEIDQWKSKVSSYTEEAKQDGKEMRKAAAQKLERAWVNVQQEWDKLKDSSGEAWEATKARFENAWQDFEEAWQDAATETDDT